MSDKDLARRTNIEVKFAGTDITKSMKNYLISLSYTDNEEDETDDLQIKLQDRDGIWIEKWMNDAIQAAADTPIPKSGDKKEASKPYKVIAKGGLAVRSRAGDQYYQYGTLPYGTIVTVKSISGGWANITYDDKNAYVKASYLKALEDGKLSESDSNGQKTSKGMKIQAVIIRQNWNSDGKDDILECGQFSLDQISASGPPNVINIKATSLPYSSTIRQMKKSKSWESYFLSGIANEIAERNGMTCMYLSEADPLYKRVEQYRTSDIEFLKKLCHDNGCSLKVSNNIIIIFGQAEYEKKKSVRTIERGTEGGYIKYKLSTASNDRYASCRVSCVKNDGTIIQATAYIDDYDKDNKDNQCLEIKQTVASTEQARLLAEKMLRLHNKYEKTATFTFPGDTSLLAGCVVELKKWGAFDGKYVIKQAKHQVSKSGYTTDITLRVALAADLDKDNSSSNKDGKNIDDIAREVIRGNWGNGSERRRRLTEAGYSYEEVQARVNEILGY